MPDVLLAPLRTAPVLEAEHHAWEAFSARFPYEETEDQLRAIGDVLGDMASGNPMDRLICGDVGFGKTEVASRRPRCWRGSTTRALPSASVGSR